MYCNFLKKYQWEHSDYKTTKQLYGLSFTYTSCCLSTWDLFVNMGWINGIFMTCISNYIHINRWDVITNTHPPFNCSAKPPLTYDESLHSPETILKMNRAVWISYLLHTSNVRFQTLDIRMSNVQYPANFTLLSYMHLYMAKSQLITLLVNADHIVYSKGRYIWGLYYEQGLTLIPAWISSHAHSKVWGEITYPFPNLNRLSLGTDK